MDSKNFTDIINELEEKPGGTLRFYGDWFGRPYDNHHKITECYFKESILEIKFDSGEMVKISEPEYVIFNDDGLFIQHAAYAEFARYAYGEPQTYEHLIIDKYSEKTSIRLIRIISLLLNYFDCLIIGEMKNDFSFNTFNNCDRLCI